MDFIVFFLALLTGLFIAGTIAAIHEDMKRRNGDEEDEAEEMSRVVISQQVPSVFDTFKKKK